MSPLRVYMYKPIEWENIVNKIVHDPMHGQLHLGLVMAIGEFYMCEKSYQKTSKYKLI
jgi:hypothetical protein